MPYQLLLRGERRERRGCSYRGGTSLRLDSERREGGREESEFHESARGSRH
jgi:hypothetical protein